MKLGKLTDARTRDSAEWQRKARKFIKQRTKEKKQMVDLDAVFSDFDNADPTATGGQNPKIDVQQKGIVEIEEVRLVESKQFNAVYLVVEFRVLETDNPEHVREGGSSSWSHNMLNKFFGAANTKQFIASAAGLDPASDEAKAISRDDVVEAWSDAQPLKGCQVNLTTNPKTAKSGYDIVVHEWSPLV